MRVLSALICLVPLLAIGDSLIPGLLVTEYPRHPKQTDGHKAYLSIEEFGDPIGAKVITRSVTPWKHESERKAIARGYLRIDKDGDYAFSTDSFYDRNVLVIGGKLVCPYADGGGRTVTIPLKKGLVEFLCAGYYGGRGASGIQVRWRPPGSREVVAIPADRLFHKADNLLANYLTIAAKDFVIAAWVNGDPVPTRQRRLILDRFGSTVEKMSVNIRKGDWIVFNVAHNPIRHGGTRYFAVAGNLDKDKFGFVSDPASENWTICDDPSQAAAFISQPGPGVGMRPSSISRKWHEGDGLMRRHAGGSFKGKAIWGKSTSTWIKYTAPPAPQGIRLTSTRVSDLNRSNRSSIRVLSATYGYGSKRVDVSDRVRQLIEKYHKSFAVSHRYLGVDLAKTRGRRTDLEIVFSKDGKTLERTWKDGETVDPATL